MNPSDKPKIVVIGSCSVDFTTYAPRLPKPGETLHGTKFTTSYGGKGANQCVAAAKLGANAYMICRFGDDHWGQQYKEYLKEIGVDTSHSYLTPNVTTGIAQISVADNGENQIVIVPGANGHLSKNDVANSKDLLTNADVLIAQLETPLETTLEAFKLSKGIKILNCAPAIQGMQKLLPYCSIICANEIEASLMTNINVDLHNIKTALLKILEYGCETAIITLGCKGAVYMTDKEKEVIHVLCEKVTPVDTTGAGDAFVGAFATFLVTYKEYPLHQIIGAACHIATLSVTKEGTQTSYPSVHNAFSKIYEFVVLK